MLPVTCVGVAMISGTMVRVSWVASSATRRPSTPSGVADSAESLPPRRPSCQAVRTEVISHPHRFPERPPPAAAPGPITDRIATPRCSSGDVRFHELSVKSPG